MEKEITGVMVYYFFICHRKLWFFYHQINMENENENVKIGKMLDESSYPRENKHINIDNVINVDYLSNEHVLHEVKKSKSIEEASIWQLKYYIYYLKCKGVTDLTGKIDYPLLRKSIHIEISEEDEAEIKTALIGIRSICNAEIAPAEKEKAICKKCAYFDFCFI